MERKPRRSESTLEQRAWGRGMRRVTIEAPDRVICYEKRGTSESDEMIHLKNLISRPYSYRHFGWAQLAGIILFGLPTLTFLVVGLVSLVQGYLLSAALILLFGCIPGMMTGAMVRKFLDMTYETFVFRNRHNGVAAIVLWKQYPDRETVSRFASRLEREIDRALSDDPGFGTSDTDSYLLN